MATVKILYWKEIPYAVRAFDDDGRTGRQLPDVFEASIDKAAMAAGMTEQSDYQAGFRWGEAEERPGTAAAVAKAVYDELIVEYPPGRLVSLARDGAADNRG